MIVLSNQEVRRYIMRLTDQWFGMTWIQMAIAIMVAILGIVNSLTVSIADRRRESGPVSRDRDGRIAFGFGAC
jgi:hypothetical protein